MDFSSPKKIWGRFFYFLRENSPLVLKKISVQVKITEIKQLVERFIEV